MQVTALMQSAGLVPGVSSRLCDFPASTFDVYVIREGIFSDTQSEPGICMLRLCTAYTQRKLAPRCRIILTAIKINAFDVARHVILDDTMPSTVLLPENKLHQVQRLPYSV